MARDFRFSAQSALRLLRIAFWVARPVVDVQLPAAIAALVQRSSSNFALCLWVSEGLILGKLT